MYKPPRTFLPSRAKRRQASHLFREFLRGAGTGALDRGTKLRRRWGLGVLIGAGAALLATHLTPLALLLAVSSAAGVVTYMTVQAVAAVAHRVANKGIPEAPNRNRKAQAWGRRVTRAVAVAGFIAASGATAGFMMVVGSGARAPAPQFRHPPPRQLNVALPPQPVAAVAAKITLS